MMAQRVLLSLLLSCPSLALAQGATAVNPVNPSGARLFPNAFASADNIAEQTATFMHGGLMAWDSGGGNWDRVLLTSGALNVSVQNGTLAVTQSGTWNIGSITTLPSLATGANTIGAVNLAQYTPVSGRLPIDGSGVTQPVSGTVTANAGTGTFAVSGTTFDGIIKDGTGDTTQANVTSGRLQVDGSGVTQPISGTVTIGTFPDNEPINVAQMNGTAVSMGNGASGTGVQRVTIASDSTGQIAVASLPNEGQQTSANSISVVVASDQSSIPTTEQSSAAILAGQQAVNGTAAALTSNTVKEVCVKALLANTINVYVGPSGVTTGTGLELGPGDSYCTRVTNTNALFVIASGAGPSVSWAARN